MCLMILLKITTHLLIESLDNKTPDEIITGQKERPPQIKHNKTQHQPKKEEIGQHVRYLLKKSQFQKSGVPRWSKNVYEIKTIDGGGYILMNPNTKVELKEKKYIWELQFLKVKEVIHLKKPNEKKEDEEKIYEQEKLDKKVKRIHQIEPSKETLPKRISKKPKPVSDLSQHLKLEKFGQLDITLIKEYDVIILEVNDDKVQAISKDYQLEHDNGSTSPEINEILINKLIKRKGMIKKNMKMVDETKKYLINKKLIF